MGIVGRTKEQALLRSLLLSKQAELMALYGRRRVGKTHLVRGFFAKKGVYFETTGLKNGSKAAQLRLFADDLSRVFFDGIPLKPPTDWLQALGLLTSAIERIPKRKPVILFFDELPWMATPRSGLIQALDRYWNTRWERHDNLKVILCGSAAAWMLDKLVNAKGGLYNRLTKRLRLDPFTLGETAAFLKSRGVRLDRQQVLELYMATGGIPHYLKEVRGGLSAAQNINLMCFQQNGLLLDEFPKLFQSLFSKSEAHDQIVRQVATRRYGITRNELLSKLEIKSGGTFTQRMSELVESGFIAEFCPYQGRREDVWYRIVDEYTLFYLKWIAPAGRRSATPGFQRDYWHVKRKSSAFIAWSGYAYEAVCLKHVAQIHAALGLQGVGCEVGSWKKSAKRGARQLDGAQVDLLFDRDDGNITLCEIKYSKDPFRLSKAVAHQLKNKIEQFEQHTNTRKQVTIAMITTQGVKRGIWSEGLVDQEVTLDDLMRPL